MFNFAVNRKFSTLSNGRRVLLRPLLEEDEQALGEFLVNTPAEEARFLKDNVEDQCLAKQWIDNLDYARVMPLVALCDDRIVGDCSLHRGTGTTRHVAELRILLAPDFRGIGLGSAMMTEAFDIAKKSGLVLLVAEIILEHVKVIKAFRRLGFDLRCTLDDYFMRRDGVTHDVAIMMRRLIRPEEYTF